MSSANCRANKLLFCLLPALRFASQSCSQHMLASFRSILISQMVSCSVGSPFNLYGELGQYVTASSNPHLLWSSLVGPRGEKEEDCFLLV